MTDRAARPNRFGAKLALLVGFGGVLFLMAMAGVDSVRVLHRLESSQRDLSRTYLAEHRALERIRSTLYRSSNAVRDYMFAENREAASQAVVRLRDLHQQMNTAIDEYARDVRPEEKVLFADLRQEVEVYWKILEPVRGWAPEQNRTDAYAAVWERVRPHQSKLAEIADRIDSINERAVDAGNARSVELFTSFRQRVAVTLVVVLALGLALATVSVLRILRLEREARIRYEEILRARGELEDLSARLLATQEEERRTISRELHDEVGQTLSALLVDLGNLGASLPEGSEEARRLLKNAKTLLESGVQSLRNIALLLRPSMLDDLGLVPALHWQAREVSRRTGLQVAVDADGVADELPDQHRTCVYRVVQEALHNSSRHAEARSVHIRACQRPDSLVLTVRDDGKGFDAAHTRGLGLVGMEERVRRLGGHFHVDSRPGAGTTLQIELPLEANEMQLEGIRT